MCNSAISAYRGLHCFQFSPCTHLSTLHCTHHYRLQTLYHSRRLKTLNTLLNIEMVYRGHPTHFKGCTRRAQIFKQEIISPFDFVFIAVGKHLNANMISFFIVMGNNSQINEIKWLRRREDQGFKSCWHGKQPPTAMLRHLGRESITGLQTRDKYCCLLYRLHCTRVM